jgi:hypothetical protein
VVGTTAPALTSVAPCIVASAAAVEVAVAVAADEDVVDMVTL